jgi:hypothetical protein
LHWPTDARREARPHSAIVRGDALMQNRRRGHDELDAGDTRALAAASLGRCHFEITAFSVMRITVCVVQHRCISDVTRRYEQPLVAPQDGQAWHEPARCMMSPQT